MDKLCVFCEHFRWADIDYIYYSTLTGGDMNGGMSCQKKHFGEEECHNLKDADGFRQVILKAVTCPDYTPPT